jgi:glycosyltransferase involved in cell wall biosynthesis
MFDEELKRLGIEMRHVSQVDFITHPIAAGMSQEEAMIKGLVKIDTKDIDWADVVMFRRYYNTSAKCKDCGVASKNPDEIRAHPHQMEIRDGITEMVWPAFESRSHNKGIIYETDDNHFFMKPWNGYFPDVMLERELISRMASRADIITTSTKPIADYYSRFNDNTRIIRNAIDPSIYTTGNSRPDHGGNLPRVVYYGSTVRMRDYGGEYDTGKRKYVGGYCGKAIEDLRNPVKKLWNVFIGVNPGTEHVIAPFFDEAFHYVENIRKFAETLASSHPDIGIAPLVGDEFDKNKSELHWLEYSMVGAAFVGQKFKYGEAPYSMVRHGVDGMLASTRSEWYSAMKSLVESKDLREQLAGAAKERILKEYDYRERAQEWAEVFRWAAEHPNYGLRKKED